MYYLNFMKLLIKLNFLPTLKGVKLEKEQSVLFDESKYKSKYWHQAICPTCNCTFKRYKKFSSEWPKYFWEFCSYTCYKCSENQSTKEGFNME